MSGTFHWSWLLFYPVKRVPWTPLHLIYSSWSKGVYNGIFRSGWLPGGYSEFFWVVCLSRGRNLLKEAVVGLDGGETGLIWRGLWPGGMWGKKHGVLSQLKTGRSGPCLRSVSPPSPLHGALEFFPLGLNFYGTLIESGE